MCKISNVLKEKYIMNFDHSDKTKELLGKIQQFMDDHLYEGEKFIMNSMGHLLQKLAAASNIR